MVLQHFPPSAAHATVDEVRHAGLASVRVKLLVYYGMHGSVIPQLPHGNVTPRRQENTQPVLRISLRT
jgi:hypothetical protein